MSLPKYRPKAAASSSERTDLTWFDAAVPISQPVIPTPSLNGIDRVMNVKSLPTKGGQLEIDRTRRLRQQETKTPTCISGRPVSDVIGGLGWNRTTVA